MDSETSLLVGLSPRDHQEFLAKPAPHGCRVDRSFFVKSVHTKMCVLLSQVYASNSIGRYSCHGVEIERREKEKLSLLLPRPKLPLSRGKTHFTTSAPRRLHAHDSIEPKVVSVN